MELCLKLEVLGSRTRAQDGDKRTGMTLTVNHALSEELSSNGGLALAQGHGVETLGHACVLCQLEQGVGGVHTRGQDEYQWSSWC